MEGEQDLLKISQKNESEVNEDNVSQSFYPFGKTKVRLPDDEKLIEETARYILTEKVDGSNLSLSILKKDNSVIFQRRNGILKDNEDFYNFKLLKIDYMIKEKGLQIVNLLEKANPEISRIVIFGELFGGKHKNHPSPEKVKPIQQRIIYSPNIEFMVFDIAIFTLRNKIARFLNFNQVQDIAKQVGFHTVPIIFEGNLEECLKYDVNFPSVVSEYLGYGKLENNKAEGVVVRSSIHPEFRVKRRNEDFLEFVPLEKRESVILEKIKQSYPDTNSNEYKRAVTFLSAISNQRLVNVLSKCGGPQSQDIQKTTKQLIKDAMIDTFEKLGIESKPENKSKNKKNTNIIPKDINQIAFKLANKITYEYYKENGAI